MIPCALDVQSTNILFTPKQTLFLFCWLQGCINFLKQLILFVPRKILILHTRFLKQCMSLFSEGTGARLTMGCFNQCFPQTCILLHTALTAFIGPHRNVGFTLLAAELFLPGHPEGLYVYSHVRLSTSEDGPTQTYYPRFGRTHFILVT